MDFSGSTEALILTALQHQSARAGFHFASASSPATRDLTDFKRSTGRTLIRVFVRQVGFAAISPHFFAHTSMTKVLSPAKKAAVAATVSQKNETNDSSLPLWKERFRRVQVAMWNYPQEDGNSRQTISISRSYQDEKKKWHNVHFFDRDDIADIRKACDQIEEQLLKLDNMAVAVGED